MFRDSTKTRYIQLRAHSKELNHKIIRTLTRQAINQGGRELGILRGGTLVFQNETESDVFLDHCIYDVRIDGQTAVKRYARTSNALDNSDERLLLDAMARASYALLRIDGKPRGIITPMYDFFRDRAVAMADIGFASCVRAQDIEGVMLAARYLTIEHEGFSMTSGASLPIQGDMIPNLIAELEPLMPRRRSELLQGGDEEWAKLTTTTLRLLLRLNAAEYIHFQDVPRRTPVRTAEPPAHAAAARNAPCPCGSGHKYKKCCGRSSSASTIPAYDEHIFAR